MRTTMARLLGLATLLVLLLGGAGLGEPPAAGKDAKKPAEEKKPSQLEELIAQAIQGNPDVRVAEAKMREAEAELNRTRLQVIQKVVAHQHTLETLAGAVQVAESNHTLAESRLKQAAAEYKRMADLKGVASRADLDAARATVDQAQANVSAAQAALQAAKADHAKAQAELPYLLGKATKDDKTAADSTQRGLEWLYRHQAEDSASGRLLYAQAVLHAHAAWQAGQQPQGTVADKLRQALDAPVSMKYEGGVSLTSVLKDMADQAGVAIVPAAGLPSDIYSRGVTLNVTNLPRGACFQLLEDLTGVQFGVRDYGIVATAKLPPGVMPLNEFWKSADKAKAAGDKK